MEIEMDANSNKPNSSDNVKEFNAMEFLKILELEKLPVSITFFL